MSNIYTHFFCPDPDAFSVARAQFITAYGLDEYLEEIGKYVEHGGVAYLVHSAPVTPLRQEFIALFLEAHGVTELPEYLTDFLAPEKPTYVCDTCGLLIVDHGEGATRCTACRIAY